MRERPVWYSTVWCAVSCCAAVWHRAVWCSAARRSRRRLVAVAVALLSTSLLTAPASSQDWRDADEEEPPIVGVLRRIARAQRHFHDERTVDQDLDGRGEYATLQELAGVLPPRGGGSVETEALLPPEYGAVDGRGTVQIGEHLIRVYLPAADGHGVNEIKGHYTRGDRALSPDLAELAWVAYAWPVSGKEDPTLCVNGYGVITRLSSRATKPAYEGRRRVPSAGAAFSAGGVRSLHSVLSIDATGQDRRKWQEFAKVESDTIAAERMALGEVRRYEVRRRLMQRIVAVGAAAWVPRPQERAVARSLIALSRAQTRFRARSLVDVDGDGFGEFGSLQEVLALIPARSAADGTPGTARFQIDPVPLRADEISEQGELRQGNYLIRLFLPAAGKGVARESRGRAVAVGSAAVDAEQAEVRWCAYAWPAEGSGAALMINQDGKLLRAESHEYVGAGRGPKPGAAFVDGGLGQIVGQLASEAQGQDRLRWDPEIPDVARVAADVERAMEPSDAESTQLTRLLHAAGLPERSSDPVIIRRRGNDEAAIHALKALVSAQAVFRWRKAVDVDADGLPEFGTFQELSSGVRCRTAADGATEDGVALSPSILSLPYQTVNRGGEVERRGYLFKLFLPGTGGSALHEVPGRALAEGGEGTFDTDAAERQWCAYAWPIDAGVTGQLVLAVNQEGVLVRLEGTPYEGVGRGPNPGAAFRDGGLRTIRGALALDTEGQDGNTWRPLE